MKKGGKQRQKKIVEQRAGERSRRKEKGGEKGRREEEREWEGKDNGKGGEKSRVERMRTVQGEAKCSSCGAKNCQYANLTKI